MALKPLDLHWALNAQLPDLQFVLPGLLPGSLGLLVAPGGTGKSYLALDFAISTALGKPIAGGLFNNPNPGRVVYLAGEESARMLAERLRGMLGLADRAAVGLSNLVLLPMAGEDCLLVSRGKRTALFQELTHTALLARLVILDPIRRLHDGDENDSGAMTHLVTALENLAQTTGAAVLGLHHANRAFANDSTSQNLSRGSTALVDGARWQLNLTRMDEKAAEAHGVQEHERHHYVALDIAKSNYLPPRPRCWLKRQPGGALQLTNLGKSPTKGKQVGGARLLG